MTTFATTVNEAECLCKVLHYRPYVPPVTCGAMEDATEEIPSEFECEILNMAGVRWLGMEQLSPNCIDRLQEEYEAFVLASKHGKDF